MKITTSFLVVTSLIINASADSTIYFALAPRVSLSDSDIGPKMASLIFVDKGNPPGLIVYPKVAIPSGNLTFAVSQLDHT